MRLTHMGGRASEAGQGGACQLCRRCARCQPAQDGRGDHLVRSMPLLNIRSRCLRKIAARHSGLPGRDCPACSSSKACSERLGMGCPVRLPFQAAMHRAWDLALWHSCARHVGGVMLPICALPAGLQARLPWQRTRPCIPG